MSLRFLDAGESHGPALMAILEGIPAGLPLDLEAVNQDLARRQKGFGSGGRMQIETDKVRVLGGVMDGKTTGAPLALLVENDDHANWQGKAVDPMTAPRPGARRPDRCAQVWLSRSASCPGAILRARDHHARSRRSDLQAAPAAVRHTCGRLCARHW